MSSHRQAWGVATYEKPNWMVFVVGRSGAGKSKFVIDAGGTYKGIWNHPSRVVEEATLNVKEEKVSIRVLPGFWTNPPPADKIIEEIIEKGLKIVENSGFTVAGLIYVHNVSQICLKEDNYFKMMLKKVKKPGYNRVVGLLNEHPQPAPQHLADERRSSGDTWRRKINGTNVLYNWPAAGQASTVVESLIARSRQVYMEALRAANRRT